MIKPMVILALALVVTIRASASSEQWYFGYDADGGIVAFNADGDARVILEHSGDRALSHHRLGPAAALFMYTREHKAEGLYYLTPEAAVELEGDVDLTLLDAQGFDILAYQHPHVVIKPRGCRFYCEWSMSVWLANLETGQLEEIAPYTFIGEPQPLGMDRQYLRYAARSAPNALRWDLFERNLSTGEVRSFYYFSNDYPSSLRASPTGEYWFYSRPTVITAGEIPESYTLLIHADGSTETLEHTPEGVMSAIGWDMVDDAVMKWTQPCETDCWLELRPVEGGDAQRFSLPMPEYAEVGRRIDEHRILVEQDEVFWLLNTSGENLRLGIERYGFGTLLSPDGQWLFTVDDIEAFPKPFRLWNLYREAVMLEGVIEDGFALDFFQHGMFIREFSLGEGTAFDYAKPSQDLPTVTLYRYGDGGVFELPANAYYFDVLPDGDVLFSGYRDGTYRVNPETGEQRLLLDDVEAISLRLYS